MNATREKIFISKLSTLLELDEKELKFDIELDSLDTWDSLSLLGYISIVKEIYGITIPTTQLETAKTMGDLIELAKRNS